MTPSKSNYHASVMIPLSSPSTSPNGGNDVHHSTSTSPNNNDDSDHVNSNNNQTALTLPDVTKSSLLNESVDNNPPSCRASINSSLETLDVISDQSSVVDEDDKLHVFYQERFDMETPPSSLHQQIQQQLQQQQHQHQQVPDLQLETTTSTTNDKEIMVENVTDALLLQQLDDSLESPIIIPETKPVERASVSIPSLELNNSNNNINNSKLKPSLPPRNPDLTVVSEATISDSPRVSPIKPVVNKPSPFVATAINNNNNNNTTPTRPTAKPIAKSMPTSPINQSPTLTSANSTPTNTTPRSTSPSTVVASKTVQIGGPDSPIKVSLRKTSAPLPSNNNNNSAPNSLQSPSSGASNDSPRKEQGAPSQVRPRAQTSKAPPELKKSHTVNSLSDPKLIATNDHSPSVSSLISVFGEKIQRRG
ncbi:hypothetical protein PPL_10256 [Heterostelium album PN500]|uniref:Uncharacterized protein n=1 Tax=Heterostelium pallidum (strain ATCC 26659 / Pp 5 / PN500) TaxID=670386 RepID=D3BQR8_HETP5|nr:hypothetical protein PPL_10256 [Heterostelium album PN500]EFA76488.1 hypothetical protein PPL_10256 [Heterostelium album PN500]|eukprot:XP_020428620.1 hypothetical protein PPL_10256 [Heterostelium album PN500]